MGNRYSFMVVAIPHQVGAIKLKTPKAVPPFDFAQGGTAFGVSSFSTPTDL